MHGCRTRPGPVELKQAGINDSSAKPMRTKRRGLSEPDRRHLWHQVLNAGDVPLDPDVNSLWPLRQGAAPDGQVIPAKPLEALAGKSFAAPARRRKRPRHPAGFFVGITGKAFLGIQPAQMYRSDYEIHR